MSGEEPNLHYPLDPAFSLQLQDARRHLATAQSVCVLTGAGVSAESGVPTFRDRGGLWEGHRVEEVATLQGFQNDPRKVWRFYNERRCQLIEAHPNPAHYALAELERRCSHFTLATQNIDDLHRAAGSRHLLELHGNVWKVQCTVCGKIEEDRRAPIPILPHCACKGLLRPHVVWFGEALAPDVLQAAFEAAGRCEVFITSGTSAVVQPAASMVNLAKSHGAYCIEVNPEETEATSFCDVSIQGPAGEVLPLLLAN